MEGKVTKFKGTRAKPKSLVKRQIGFVSTALTF